MRRRKAGFTLIEALVAVALTGVGVVAALKGVAAMSSNQSKLITKERMHALAVEKYQEIIAIQDFATPNGDFTDHNESRYLWQMTLNPVTLPSSTTNSTTAQTATQQSNAGQLNMLTVSVHPTNSSSPNQTESVSGVVWESPQALNGVTQ
ncbi:MAG TPA: prepilin-type N-terminal cleavage/methylation domain-containing protein [Fimbriimonadaceae bacterium]